MSPHLYFLYAVSVVFKPLSADPWGLHFLEQYWVSVQHVSLNEISVNMHGVFGSSTHREKCISERLFYLQYFHVQCRASRKRIGEERLTKCVDIELFQQTHPTKSL